MSKTTITVCRGALQIVSLIAMFIAGYEYGYNLVMRNLPGILMSIMAYCGALWVWDHNRRGGW